MPLIDPFAPKHGDGAAYVLGAPIIDTEFFADIVRLPSAYAGMCNADAPGHVSAARNLYQQSINFLDSLPLQPGLRVLDIGAGYGFHSAYFARRGCEVVGMAIHVTDELRSHARKNGYEYQNGEMHHLNFADETFDLVWSHHCLEHSFAPLIALREWYRVLKPGGRLAVTVPPHKPEVVSGHFHTGWSVGQLLYLVGVAGYELRAGIFLEEGYNVRALVGRPSTPFNAVGASWIRELKERLPASLQPHLRAQPGSLGGWNFPGRIRYLDATRCDFFSDRQDAA